MVQNILKLEFWHCIRVSLFSGLDFKVGEKRKKSIHKPVLQVHKDLKINHFRTDFWLKKKTIFGTILGIMLSIE